MSFFNWICLDCNYFGFVVSVYLCIDCENLIF